MADTTPAAKKTTTAYVILTRRANHAGPEAHEDRGWREAATIEAASADAALRLYATDKNDGMDLVAIPARSWQPRRITIKTTTRVTLA